MNNLISHEFTTEYLETLKHKTPFFLFSKKKVMQNVRQFETLFPGSDVNYAMKANSEPELLEMLAEAGCGFEVASVYELHLLKKIGVSPQKIIFGTSIKPTAHIKEFFEYGVDRFAYDSFEELEKIAAVAPGSRVYVRILVNDAGSVFKFSEKFGTDTESVVPLLLRAKELGLQPYGISFHVGSQASNPEAWANAVQSIHPVLEKLQEVGITIEVLNLGGGYPCNYASGVGVPTLQEISEHFYKQYRKLPYAPQLILEPGRGIVADAGVLVATVIARVPRQGNMWLFLDAGVYNGLFEAMAYQGSTRYPITSMRPTDDSGEMLFSLSGPTGDSPDVITREAMLPTDMQVGDKLVIHNVGAYSLVVASRFNGFPKPEVYFV